MCSPRSWFAAASGRSAAEWRRSRWPRGAPASGSRPSGRWSAASPQARTECLAKRLITSVIRIYEINVHWRRKLFHYIYPIFYFSCSCNSRSESLSLHLKNGRNGKNDSLTFGGNFVFSASKEYQRINIFCKSSHF